METASFTNYSSLHEIYFLDFFYDVLSLFTLSKKISDDFDETNQEK